MKYCGCVTDHLFKLAIMELYPNRRFNHPDQFERKKLIQEKRDLPEYAQAFQEREYLRVYDAPKADMNNPRWAKARSYHLFGYCSIKDKNIRPMGELVDLLKKRGLLK